MVSKMIIINQNKIWYHNYINSTTTSLTIILFIHLDTADNSPRVLVLKDDKHSDYAVVYKLDTNNGVKYGLQNNAEFDVYDADVSFKYDRFSFFFFWHF